LALLTDTELHQLFEKLQLPELGRARIRFIRDNPPSRAVRSNKASGKTRYTGIKMPFVIEAEAVSTEYVAIVEWDHDEETLEYYAQPQALKIRYLGSDRVRRISTQTTPDYLRITSARIAFVECKRDDELERLAKQTPARYQRNADGRWCSPPAEAAAAEFGCAYEIRSSSANNWALHENLEILKDFQIGMPAVVDALIAQNLRDRLSRAGWISVFELVHHEPAISADHLYALVAARQVFFPITQHRLSDQENAFLFRDETTYRAREAMVSTSAPRTQVATLGLRIAAGLAFDWDGSAWQILNDGAELLMIKRLQRDGHEEAIAELTRSALFDLVRAGRITVHQPSGQALALPDGSELLRRASTTHLQEAVWRLEVLENRADPGKNPYAGRKRRARMYWQRQFRDAEVRYGNGLIGLLPRRSGNRKPKASPATLELATEVIASDWEDIRRKRRLASWGRYRLLAREKGLEAVSYRYFCTMVKARSGHRQAVSRIGEKAAYDLEPHYLELEWTTPRHGVRPWHICHVDHTPLPLKFVHSALGKIVSTVWLTILTDAHTRKVLAYYLSFDEPSYRSCMMVMRDCVRRNSCVPQILVCDQGADFMSVYFETLLASLNITKRERRAGKPKAGSVCERIFNTSQSQFVKVLLGSTDLVEQHFRSISPEVDPTRHAVWTLERFDKGMDAYLAEVYHPNHHAGLGMSPNAAWALGLRSHGHREHRAIPFDPQFIINTCPGVRKGKAKVTPAGIKINYRWFSCAELLAPGVLGISVDARYDPFNCGTAYAYVGGQWHTCYSEFHAVFSHYSERAVRMLTERLKLQDREAGRQLPMTAERLAVFLSQREQDETLARQVLNDAEAAPHRQRVQHVNAAEPRRAEVAKSSPRIVNSLPAETSHSEMHVLPAPRRSIRILEDL
jgi:putative transposase